jgi:hypothetical protein
MTEDEEMTFMPATLSTADFDKKQKPRRKNPARFE